MGPVKTMYCFKKKTNISFDIINMVTYCCKTQNTCTVRIYLTVNPDVNLLDGYWLSRRRGDACVPPHSRPTKDHYPRVLTVDQCRTWKEGCGWSRWDLHVTQVWQGHMTVVVISIWICSYLDVATVKIGSLSRIFEHNSFSRTSFERFQACFGQLPTEFVK